MRNKMKKIVFLLAVLVAMIAVIMLLKGCKAIEVKEEPLPVAIGEKQCPPEVLYIYVQTPFGNIPIMFKVGEVDELMKQQREMMKEKERAKPPTRDQVRNWER